MHSPDRVESVAAAIYVAACYGQPVRPWSSTKPWVKERYRLLATAAIEEMSK